MGDTNEKPLVFLDTNSINSGSLDVLFGQPDMLSKLGAIAHIVLPRVVFDELISHKKESFDKDRQKLMQSRLLHDVPDSREKLQELTFEFYLDAMIRNCPIEYDVASLTDYETAMTRIYDLALHNKAPFNKGSDKGFKDAYVVLTIDEYLQQHPEYSEAVLITDDSRMTDYYPPESQVKVYSTINATLKALKLSSQDSECATESEAQSCTSQDIDNTSSEKRSDSSIDIKALINELNDSQSFLNTHSIVEKYKDTDISNLSPRDAKGVLDACIKNSQVSYILSDKDVKHFIQPIFIRYQKSLDTEEYSAFVDALGLPNDRLDAFGHVMLSRSEKDAYNNFAQGLVSHIQSRSFDSSISTDVDGIESQLNTLISLETIDETAVTWYDVALIFIKDGVSASSSKVALDTLQNFLSLLKHGSDQKKTAIINAISFRLEEIEQDIPF